MKTKTSILTALVAMAGSATVMAQVYSLNVVGYVNVNAPAGFSMIANQLNTTNNTLASLIPAPPAGTMFYKFNPVGGWDIYTFDDLDMAWLPNGNVTLNPGEGGFLRTASPLALTFVGEVLQGSLTNNIPLGFSVKSSMVPQQGKLVTDLKFPNPAPGDMIYKYVSGTYQIYAFDDLDMAWLPSEPVINVGESFFSRKGGSAATWIRAFDPNQP